jgi:hypothetical protein
MQKCEKSSLRSNPFSKPVVNHTLKDLEELQNEIIRENDSALAYFFVSEFNYKPYRMQKLILDKKDAKYACLFAQNIKNCDVKALQQVVVDSYKAKVEAGIDIEEIPELGYICKFACFVEDANRKPLENIILKSKNVKYAHMYLKHVEGARVKKFQEVILASGKPRYLFELAKHTKNPQQVTQIEDLIIASGSFTYMRLFAEKIKTANVTKIEQAVLDSDNVSEIKKFAKYVKNSRMKRFFLVL